MDVRRRGLLCFRGFWGDDSGRVVVAAVVVVVVVVVVIVVEMETSRPHRIDIDISTILSSWVIAQQMNIKITTKQKIN